MRIVIVVLVGIAAGCGGGPSCKDAVTRAAKRFGTEASPKVAMMIGTCEQDGWPGSARACFAGAETEEKLEGCVPALAVKVPPPVVEPSEATRKIAARADKGTIKALLFFRDHDEVGDLVRGYFEHLGNVTIEHHDRLTEPELAQRYHATADITVVLVDGDKDDRLSLHTDLARARFSELPRFDRDVARILEKLLRPTLKAYLVAGHGEITDPDSLPPDVASRRPERRTAMLQAHLVDDGYQPITTRLSEDIPADATVVLWFGPAVEPSASEVAVLGRYLDRGGSLLVALDPTSPVGLGALEEKLGVRFIAEHVVDDITFLPQRGTSLDHRFVVTNKFVDHPSVRSLARVSGKGMVMVDPGRLEPANGAGTGPKVTFTIKTVDTSFVDINDNLAFDGGTEHRASMNIAASIEGTKLRAVVVADVDLFSDVLMSTAGKPMATLLSGPLLDDVLRWLGPAPVLVADHAPPEMPSDAERDAQKQLDRQRELRALVRALAAKDHVLDEP
jgi:hypothetical protein